VKESTSLTTLTRERNLDVTRYRDVRKKLNEANESRPEVETLEAQGATLVEERVRNPRVKRRTTGERNLAVTRL